MTAEELCDWLGAHGWDARVLDDDTVRAERHDKPRPRARLYLRLPGIIGSYWSTKRVTITPPN